MVFFPVVEILAHYRGRIARQWLGRGFSPPKLNVSPPPQSSPILIFLYESAQKCIISHKIPHKFSGDGAQPTPTEERYTRSPDPTL